MSSPIALTAILTLGPGTEQRFLELFNNCAEYAKNNEPFVWLYELVKGRADPKGQVTDMVIREVYENQAMMDKHIASAPVQQFIKEIGQGLATSSKIIYTDYKGEIGFSSKL